MNGQYEDARPGQVGTGTGPSVARRRRRWRPFERLIGGPAKGFALIGLSVWNCLVGTLVISAGSLATAGVGLLLLPWSLGLLRSTANAARRRASDWSGVEIEELYRPLPEHLVDAQGFGAKFSRVWARLQDPQTWRDLVWAVFDCSVGCFLAAVAAGLFLYGVYGFVLGIFWTPLTQHGMSDWYGFIHVTRDGVAEHYRWLTFPQGAAYMALSYWATPWLLWQHGLWTRVLLRPTANARQAALARRVTQLTETRADAVDTQAAELRRIERDLHDGAQARLVAMGMNLGAAEALLDQRPEAARALLVEAREASAKALTELRELVRGIHPPVLADRGLGDAVRALALDSPLDVVVTVDLPGRLEPAVESAAYFAVSELLTNVAKHAHATKVRVDLWYGAGRLRVVCTDDGRGGAVIGGAGPGFGSGLAGIERRVGTFDGVLAVHSPVGGPTVMTLEIPCASSSAKTSTS